MSKDCNFVGFWSYEEIMAKLAKAKDAGKKSVSYTIDREMEAKAFAYPFIHKGYPVSVIFAENGIEIIVHLTDDWS